MKKLKALLNFVLPFAVLFAMLFQTVHSYEHVSKQLLEKKCFHKSNSSQEITHQHHNYDTCYVCNFTVASFISSDIAHFEFKKINHFSGYTFFKSREITSYFKGSLFALRGPPSFIV